MGCAIGPSSIRENCSIGKDSITSFANSIDCTRASLASVSLKNLSADHVSRKSHDPGKRVRPYFKGYRLESILCIC